MAKRDMTMKDAAAALGVTVKWIRARIAEGTVAPKRAGGKGTGRYLMTPADIETLRDLAAAPSMVNAPPTVDDPEVEPSTGGTLARLSRLESDRANLLAQVAWERAIAQEQQKALEIERERVEKLLAELDTQRSRVERLKSLGVWDRMMGQHKDI